MSEREMHSLTGISPQASVSEPTAALTPETSADPAPGVGLPSPKTPANNDSDSVQESGQPKFSSAPTYAGSSSSLSYGVVPKAITTTISSEENSSTPAVKSSPSASDVSVQPPVFGQSTTTGPSFSYNIVTSNSAGSPNDQQLQSNNATGSSQPDVVAGSVPTTESSLTPPVPGKSEYPNIYVHGTARNLPDQIHSPVPIPQGTPSIAAGFSFSRPSQVHAAVNAFSQQNTSTTTMREAGTSTSSIGSLSVALPAYPPMSHSSTAPGAPSLFPANQWMPPNLPFPSHPGAVGSPATPGPPGIPLPGPFSSNMTIRPMVSGMPLPASVPMNSAVQQQIYPPFQSVPAMAPPPQSHWLQPPQVTGMQRPLYVPYPTVINNTYPLPVRGLAVPSLTDSQPPGFSPVGLPRGTAPPSMEYVQHVSSPGVQSELPPATDHDEKVNGHGGPVNDAEVDVWTAHKTDTGTVYYYNAVTGESTYEKPHGFKGEPDKVTAQSTPVSWEKLAGTDWVLATTDDGKKYYYNSKTKVSSWQIPAEVTELMKKKQEGDLLRENTMSVPNASTLSEKGSVSNSLSTPAVNNGGRDAVALRASVLPGSSSALDLIKKKLQDSGIPVTSSTLPASSGPNTADVNGLKAEDTTTNDPQGENSKEKLKDANGEGNLSDSSSDSEDVESGPTKEDCVIQFKEMLKERGVAPFSKWEKELPKIVFDPRFKAVPSHSTRRSLFDHYVRTRAEEERKEKRAALKAAVEGFRQLLEEASEDIDHKTDYQSFKKNWGDDPRFKALDRKEREVLLNERVLSLRRAVEEKIRAAREAAASSFKSMLRDKGDINPNTRWSRVKDSLRNDPRYKSVKHEDREVLFNEYISELRAADEETDRAANSKREELDKLKEREREMRKRKEREEQDMERVRLKIRRKEATSSFQTLLVETIKDPQASWTESKPRLERDPQGRATHADLDQGDAEKLFREHVKALYERCVSDFQALLAEVLSTEAVERVTEDGKSALTSWSTAKRLIKPDPRYSKMPRKDRESIWKRYVEEIQRKRKLASDPAEDRLNSEKKSKTSLESGKSPAGSRRVRDRR